VCVVTHAGGFGIDPAADMNRAAFVGGYCTFKAKVCDYMKEVWWQLRDAPNLYPSHKWEGGREHGCLGF